VADVPGDEVVLVLEGAAKAGVRAGRDAHVRTVHAPKDGDSTILAEARKAAEKGREVTVVTADRALAANVGGVGARVVGPSWLLDRMS
jgi:rRNA-processing protein FCF1